MNLADSERMAGVLEAAGYDCAADPSDADVLVYNTCSIREKAEVKVYSALGKQARIRSRLMSTLMSSGCSAGLLQGRLRFFGRWSGHAPGKWREGCVGAEGGGPGVVVCKSCVVRGWV
jgi:hypothetical protein